MSCGNISLPLDQIILVTNVLVVNRGHHIPYHISTVTLQGRFYRPKTKVLFIGAPATKSLEKPRTLRHVLPLDFLSIGQKPIILSILIIYTKGDA